MNKKIIILILVLLILVAVGVGIFWWWQNREIKGSPEDYIIKETPEGKIVENKKAGLTVKAPEGWEVKKMEVKEGSIIFYSPEVGISKIEQERILPLEKGCMLESTVTHEKMSFSQIKLEAGYTLSLLGLEFIEFEEVSIRNYPAIKNIFNTKQGGPGMGIYIPKNDKMYWLYVFWAPNEREKCEQEFEKFLETVSIK